MSTKKPASPRRARRSETALRGMVRLEPLLLDLHARVTITPVEFAEAQRRLSFLGPVLERGFGGSVYVNGSIAHGDALTPLSDVDLGVILAAPVASIERRRSPTKIMRQACSIIEASRAEPYFNLEATFHGQKRSILVNFNDGRAGKAGNFTADVIIALEYPEGPGVLVPNLHNDGWDRSHPLAHNLMMSKANSATTFSLNRVVRLVKYWNRGPIRIIPSWNIKALALSSVITPLSLAEGLHSFFHHAASSLGDGLTPDPAGISPPIALDFPRIQVVESFNEARDTYDELVADAAYGSLADLQNRLEEFFRGFGDSPPGPK